MLNTKEIGERFKAARLKKGLNPRQFAITAGVDPSQYSKVEKGKAGLSIEKITDICDKLGLNVDFISTGKGEVLIGEAKIWQGKRNDLVHGKNEKPGSDDYQADFKDAMATIRGYNDFLQRMLETSLGKVLRDQEGNSGLLAELLRRDVRQEAGGSLEKEKEILDEIVHRIGPKLNSDLKEDIGRDGRS